MSAFFMTKNSTTVSMDSVGKSQFASAIGAVSIDFWSERIATFFVVKLERKVLQKPKKKQKQKNNIQKKIYSLRFRVVRCK